jgi:hypothetical protein
MLVLTRRKDHFLSIDNGKIEIFFDKKKDRFYIVGDKSIPVGNAHVYTSKKFKEFISEENKKGESNE